MVIKAIYTLAAFGAFTACAQTQQTDDTQTQQTQNVEAQQPAAAQAASSACWVRGDAASLGQRPSAFDSVSASVGGQSIKLCYSRPKMNGRTVVGELVPYDQPWRLGANEATTIHMPAAGTIAGVAVPAGSYSLYVVPGTSEWRVHVNRTAQRWGVPINAAVTGNDVGSGTVKPEAVAQPVEALTAKFENTNAQGADLVFEWEKTRLRIPVRING